MSTLSINKIIEGGLAENLQNAASSGDNFPNSGIEFIHVVNDHASESYTVSVTAQTITMRHPTDDGAALSTISSGAHALKIEVLYLDQQ